VQKHEKENLNHYYQDVTGLISYFVYTNNDSNNNKIIPFKEENHFKNNGNNIKEKSISNRYQKIFEVQIKRNTKKHNHHVDVKENDNDDLISCQNNIKLKDEIIVFVAKENKNNNIKN